MKYPDDYINKIICGDYESIIDYGIPSDSIDITITSPPYNIGLDYGDKYDDNISAIEYVDFCYNWLGSVYAITKETGRLYCVLDDRLIWDMRVIAEEIGWNYVQLLAWCKPNFAGKARFSGDWNSMTEYVLLFRKGKSTKMLNPKLEDLKVTTHNWFVETAPQSNFKRDYQKKVHPAQIPVNLIRKWIARTPGQVVLDPFCGAGSVCIAAKELGRDYIGIDISEEYCRLAEERIHSINISSNSS
jgi:DNA modification methylase